MSGPVIVVNGTPRVYPRGIFLTILTIQLATWGVSILATLAASTWMIP